MTIQSRNPPGTRKAATSLTTSFHTSQTLKDLTSRFEQESSLIRQALTDENFFHLREENTPKSWKFKVKDESEKIAQDGFGHPFGNRGYGIHSGEHPSQMWAWHEAHTWAFLKRTSVNMFHCINPRRELGCRIYFLLFSRRCQFRLNERISHHYLTASESEKLSPWREPF